MNEDIKGRWIDALLSGRYPKTQQYLQDQDGYCCLGVLCELAVQDGVIGQPKKTTWGNFLYGEDGVCGLPSDVVNWAGLRSSMGVLRMDREPLYMINDRTDTFDEVIREIKDFA